MKTVYVESCRTRKRRRKRRRREVREQCMLKVKEQGEEGPIRRRTNKEKKDQ